MTRNLPWSRKGIRSRRTEVSENLFYYLIILRGHAGRVKRLRRLMLVKSIPASSMASSLGFSSTLTPTFDGAGRRNVPSSKRLYHSAKPSASNRAI